MQRGAYVHIVCELWGNVDFSPSAAGSTLVPLHIKYTQHVGSADMGFSQETNTRYDLIVGSLLAYNYHLPFPESKGQNKFFKM